ncbi:MAG TPA: MerR family transcriptional regulator [Pyrinomonadaceae bacterium]|jgi:DNA-binding transcriptional MerR regulator|nr:MerR family transcriptional regulator [Pyrinomonadaceae bacterium]
MSAQLEKIRSQKYIGVVELARQAARILAEIGTTQDRGTVSEMPDERTLRYYLAEGLLSPAAEKQGTASVFGYVHLLQLLVVKKLQSEHLPIRKIKELVDGRTGRELERLLGLDAKAGAKNEALSYLEKLLTRSTSPANAPPADASRNQNFASPAAAPHRPTPNLASERQAAPSSPASWSRVEIEPGLELHVRGDYAPPAETKGVRQLTRLILNVLEAYRGGKSTSRK